ncbi:hypothetical protein L198_04234 [Cryptococcus wingfieldii CBS 7118]|uniref:Uncharacterized protein n=1 Tax=Cryptococcus wingfieldii CBS 7118 TaxID=1295528 RepID=A0A1E3J6M5_9TREE|nr:hypothetical protein L198_04234 [Cryptococcus wingfieldii CBS 7118]ODN96519.1 hypothetical protein L198_04234 [Cryptococcus wingfieldii CBS 7118]
MAALPPAEASKRSQAVGMLRNQMRREAESGNSRHKHCKEVHGEMLQFIALRRGKKASSDGRTSLEKPAQKSRPKVVTAGGSKPQLAHHHRKERLQMEMAAKQRAAEQNRIHPATPITPSSERSPAMPLNPNQPHSNDRPGNTIHLPRLPYQPDPIRNVGHPALISQPSGHSPRHPMASGHNMTVPLPVSDVAPLPVALSRLAPYDLNALSQKPEHVRLMREPYRSSVWLQIMCRPTTAPHAISFNLLTRAYLHFLSFSARETASTPGTPIQSSHPSRPFHPSSASQSHHTPMHPRPPLALPSRHLPPLSPTDLVKIFRNLWPQVRFSGGVPGNEELFCLGMEFRAGNAGTGSNAGGASSRP